MKCLIFLGSHDTVFHSHDTFSMPTGNVEGLQFLCLLTLCMCVHTCVFTADFLMGVREFLLVVSGCLPLVIDDVNDLFMCYWSKDSQNRKV